VKTVVYSLKGLNLKEVCRVRRLANSSNVLVGVASAAVAEVPAVPSRLSAPGMRQSKMPSVYVVSKKEMCWQFQEEISGSQ